MVQIKKLKKLLAHMKKGKLSVDKFDFRYLRNVLNPCRTVGCMAGEMPQVFPESVRIKRYGYGYILVIKKRKYNSLDLVQNLSEFFGLTEDETGQLFIPKYNDKNSKRLPDWATRSQVAKNLERFIIRKEKELAKKKKLSDV